MEYGGAINLTGLNMKKKNIQGEYFGRNSVQVVIAYPDQT
jgi:hypothetical protein